MNSVKEGGIFENLIIESSPVTPINREEEDYDKHDDKWQKAKRFAEDTRHRKGLIFWVKWVVSLWLSFVLAVVAFNNILCLKLSDNVLITLLATTTANILGLAYIVLKGLFKQNNED